MFYGLPSLFIFILNFINKVSVFIISLTLLLFLWGIFKLVASGKDSKERAEAKGYIVWGIIALAIMVSVWGLVNLVRSSFGLGGPANVQMPDFPSII